MTHDELVTVYTVSNSVEAGIIKGALEEEGVRCFVQGELQAAEAGLAGIEIAIQVPANEAERARKFIMKHEHHG